MQLIQVENRYKFRQIGITFNNVIKKFTISLWIDKELIKRILTIKKISLHSIIKMNDPAIWSWSVISALEGEKDKSIRKSSEVHHRSLENHIYDLTLQSLWIVTVSMWHTMLIFVYSIVILIWKYWKILINYQITFSVILL